MQDMVYKGKHAELCYAIAAGKRDEAMGFIYAFFRSEDNTDSYSIPLLTTVRELMEDQDSDEMYRMRIRMRSNGDRVLINLAQFLTAFEANGQDEIAETLADKCLAELPKLARSMQEYADEEGLSSSTQLAGQRIREAVRLLVLYYERNGSMPEMERAILLKLETSKVFLTSLSNIISEDLMQAAQAADRRGDEAACHKLCREILREYGDTIDRVEADSGFSREDLETLVAVRYAYENLSKKPQEDVDYEGALARIDVIFSDKD